MKRILIAAVIVAATIVVPVSAADASSARHFTNCTAMHKVYAHGVGSTTAKDHVSGHSKPVTNFVKSNSLYTANKSLDRDHDSIACEAH